MIVTLLRYFFPNGVLIGSTDSTTNLCSKRVVVTAPTNKAVTVIASRFLDAIKSLHEFPLNLVLIGVEDKLIGEEEELKNFTSEQNNYTSQSYALSSTLRNIFIYSWVDTFVEAYRSILNDICTTFRDMVNVSKKIVMILCQSKQYYARLLRSLPDYARICGYVEQAESFHSLLEDLSQSSNVITKSSLDEIVARLLTVLECLESLIKHEAAVKRQLLATANIIFCTLSTAGNAAMINTPKIHGMSTLNLCNLSFNFFLCFPQLS